MSDSTTPAYLVARLNINDRDEYMQRYVTPLMPMLNRVGARVVAVSPEPKVLEGQWGGTWTVVIKFPSMDAAQDWYDSADYKPLKDLRINELTDGAGTVVFIPGFEPGGGAR